MLRLHRTLALCFWCLLVVHKQASADEEGLWGPTPSREKPAQEKPGSYWWTASLSKLTSLPSLPFRLPFYPAEGKREPAEMNATGQELSEPIDQSGSGDGINSEAPALPTSSTQFLSTVTEIRTESLPAGTSHSPHGRSDNGTLVTIPATHIRNTQSPTSSSMLEQNGTHRHPPWDTTQALTVQYLPKDNGFLDKHGFLDKPSTTITPEITVPPDKTTTHPGMETKTPPLTHPDTTLVKVQDSSESHPSLSVLTPGIATASGKVTTPKSEAKADQADEAGVAPDGYTTDVSSPLTTSLPGETDTTAESSQNLQTVTWMSNPGTLLPDCNKEHSRACNNSGDWESTSSSEMKSAQNNTSTNQSSNPWAFSSPLMLVPLYTDWNSAMAAWGLAWEAHVYGAGCVFAMLTLASALNLLCLPLRCPSGCGYFALVSLFLLAAGGTRSFSLLYDAYGHQDRLPSSEASLMLYEAPFPCLTAAFGLVFLLLSMRSRMQLSYSAFQRPCFLACLVTLHFAAAFGPGTLLKFYQQKPPLCLFLSLISRGAFVGLATFLSTAYFVFYVYVRADSKHIYHLNNTSPTPAERYNRCPFAESRDWDRAALAVCLSALFCLACAGLQLYAMLNATGVTGGEEVFHPWCWWAFHFSCRLCELGVCLTLALVVAQPVYCANQLPSAGSCWTELLASKAPILPGTCQWSLGQQEKLVIVDTVGLGETESLPLYTLMDERLSSSLNGLDLMYHSNRALAYRDLEVNLDMKESQKFGNGVGGEPSGGSSFTSDSTTDLRPPSPINLRRSIDEALFGDALFPMSLFSTTKHTQNSDLSVNNHCALPSLCNPLSDDCGLYRTSSCANITSKAGEIIVRGPPSQSQSSSSCSSPERWRGSSLSSSPYRASIGDSSLVLCPSPEVRQQGHPQRDYQTLGAASQESLDLDMSSEADRSVQEEFMSACRQIDALSICSETIDL